jgi:hypothetical protein
VVVVSDGSSAASLVVVVGASGCRIGAEREPSGRAADVQILPHVVPECGEHHHQRGEASVQKGRHYRPWNPPLELPRLLRPSKLAPLSTPFFSSLPEETILDLDITP